MDCIKVRLSYILLLFHFTGVSFAALFRKITDENNEAIPYVSVYLAGTTQGATSNKDGKYSIELSPETGIGFQYIGYKIHSEILEIESAEQKIILNIKMEPQPYQIAEVTVNANAEDPAYEIMRKAIKMRKYYKEQVQSYSAMYI